MYLYTDQGIMIFRGLSQLSGEGRTSDQELPVGGGMEGS